MFRRERESSTTDVVVTSDAVAQDAPPEDEEGTVAVPLAEDELSPAGITPANDSSLAVHRLGQKLHDAGGEDRMNGLHNLPEMSSEASDTLAAVDNYCVSISDPRTGAFETPAVPMVRQIAALPFQIAFHYIFQSVAAVAYIIGICLLLAQLGGGDGSSSGFTLVCMIVFLIETLAFVGYEGPFSMGRLSWWRLGVIAVTVVGVAFELTACIAYGFPGAGHKSGFTLIVLVRLLCWVLTGSAQARFLTIGARILCSADRRRYDADGVNLDLSYVHRNMIAMAWPANNFERFFRNPLPEVKGYFDYRHPSSYLIVNLCSERTYPDQFFSNRTSWYPMDDHNPAELEMIVAFCQEATAFVSHDPTSRVVAVHCKGGKGRTGTLICAYLMFTGTKRTADEALAHFAHIRTRRGSSKFQGVQAPSQGRYVRYFEQLLTLPNMTVPRRRVRVRRLRLHNIPHTWYALGVGKLWFTILTKPCTERRVAFLSNPTVTFSAAVPDPSSYTKKQLRDLCGKDEERLYEECNEMDTDAGGTTTASARPASTSGSPLFSLDTTSFRYIVGEDDSQVMSYEAFQEVLTRQTLVDSKGKSVVTEMNVSLEFAAPERLPVLEGDVVFKFFFARNDPNPLEPPVQFWLHTSFEKEKVMHLPRDQIDGPPKDKKAKRYPLGFAITLETEEVSSSL